MNNDQPPKAVLYFGVICFLLLTVISLIWFIISFLSLIEQLNLKPNIFRFDKSGLYMLGVAIGLGSLSSYMVFELWTGKPTPKKMSTIVGKLAMLGIGCMILLPQVVHYSLSHFLDEYEYHYCAKASHRWLHYQTLVYTLNMKSCEQVEK